MKRQVAAALAREVAARGKADSLAARVGELEEALRAATEHTATASAKAEALADENARLFEVVAALDSEARRVGREGGWGGGGEGRVGVLG